MGAVTFFESGKGTSMGDAFNKLYEEAKEEHGHEQGYSGAINCTHLSRDVTRDYHAAKDKKKFIKDLEEKVSKGDTWGICVKEPKANKNKVKSVVKITPQKGAKKWETRYIGYTLFDDREVCSGKTQGECIKKARAYAEKHQCRVHLGLTKVLTKGDTSIGVVEYKQAKNEAKGEYVFVGCAPY
jgi:hypothetical protein